MTTQEKKKRNCTTLLSHSKAAWAKQKGMYIPGFCSLGEGDRQNLSSKYEETHITDEVHGSSLKSFTVKYIKTEDLSIKDKL